MKSKQQRKVNIDTRKEADSDKRLLTYADMVEKSTTEEVVDLSQIYSDLLASENRSSNVDTSPPNLCTYSAHISKDSGSNGKRSKPLFCMQDRVILSLLEELEQVQSTSITDSD